MYYIWHIINVVITVSGLITDDLGQVDHTLACVQASSILLSLEHNLFFQMKVALS